MVISTGLFIDGRVGELDLIRAGWVFMHRTMSDDDRMRFEQMINTPGFCVKKFEEMYLLRRINPFAPTEEQRIMMFDHSDCACKNAQDAREMSEMKQQLGDFFAKWENVFERLSPNLPASCSSNSLHKIDDLQKPTAKQLNDMKSEKIINVNDGIMENTEVQSIKENGSKENYDAKEEIGKKNVKKSEGSISNQNNIENSKIMKAGTVESDDQENLKKVDTNQNDKEVNAAKAEIPEIVNQDFIKKKNNKKREKVQDNPVEVNTSKVEISKMDQPSKEPLTLDNPADDNMKSSNTPHHGVAEQCLWNVAHISGKTFHPKLQYAEAVASGVAKAEEKKDQVSPMPEQPPVQKLEEQQKVEVMTLKISSARSADPIKELNVDEPITVACNEDKMEIPMSICTDISPAITDNSRSAGTPDSGMISDISEVKPADSEIDNIEKDTQKSKDPEKLTGRDGRRYRQKLREAEKVALAQVVKEETGDIPAQEVCQRDSVESECIESDNTNKTGKEKRRLKDKLRKEKKEQEKMIQPSESTEEEAGVTKIEKVPAPVETINDVPGFSENSIVHVEAKLEELVTVSEDINNVESSETQIKEEETEVTPEDDTQVKKLSKSQKKRAQKKVVKGVYVVNDNRSHSVELLPGEYKIVQLDQHRNIKEVKFEYKGEGEVNGEMKVDEKKEGDVVEQPKKRSIKNMLVAGNLSKDILDNGKWLAYVIDDKNPNVPKFGEVSNVDVAKTIKMLDSQMNKKSLQPDGYVDDVDYSCTKNPGHISTTIKQILPELDADVVRGNFAKLIEFVEPGCYAGPTDEEIATQPEMSDLQLMIDQDPSGFKFHTELARRTSPLLVGNHEFREFCRKYSKSKYDSKVISSLIKKYVDTRIVHHYERYKKLADREARRISMCWTKVTDSSPFALMLMLYINNPTSNVGFGDVEAVLFPQP